MRFFFFLQAFILQNYYPVKHQFYSYQIYNLKAVRELRFFPPANICTHNVNDPFMFNLDHGGFVGNSEFSINLEVDSEFWR